jgi:hypothetical protein
MLPGRGDGDRRLVFGGLRGKVGRLVGQDIWDLEEADDELTGSQIQLIQPRPQQRRPPAPVDEEEEPDTEHEVRGEEERVFDWSDNIST